MVVIGLDSDGSLTDDRYIIGNETILLSNYTLAE